MSCYGVYLNFFLVMINVRRGLGDYSISNQTTNWSAAVEHCQIAMPERYHCSKNQWCLKINTKYGMTDFASVELWVGYYKIDMSLHYVGCLHNSKISEDHIRRERDGRKNARECFRKCLASTYIGISKHYCYCHKIYDDETHPTCGTDTVQCHDLPNLQCGSRTHMSVYKNLKKDETSSSKTYKYHSTYSAPENLYNVDIIVEYRATDINPSSFDDKQYGYIIRDGGKCLLKFTSDNSNKRALCKKEATHTTTKPMDETTAKSNTMHNTESKGMNTTENNDAKVVALVSVGVILAVLNVVVIAVFVCKRNKLSHCFDKTSESNERETARSPEHNHPDCTWHVPTNDIDQSTLNNVEYNYPDFSMLNVLNSTEGVVANGNQRAKTEFPTNDLEKHVYDKSDNGDEYNIISNRPKMVAMETYDHTVPVTKRGVNSSDDTNYDLSMSDNTHLQGKLRGLTDNVYNTENDTYNKLGYDIPEVRKSTDKLYGTKQTEACGVVLRPVSERDRTYDTTSQSFKPSRVTDNHYSKLESE